MFSTVDLPVVRSDRFIFGGRPAASDVTTNQRSLAGRLYVIVLDDFGTSLFRTNVVKRHARHFVERHFGDNDVGAIVYTSGRADASQEFTSDSALLLAAIDKFIGRKLRSSTLDRIDSVLARWRRASALPNEALAGLTTAAKASGVHRSFTRRWKDCATASTQPQLV